MSEKTVTLRTSQVCDLCGHRIRAGEKCRLIRDDFMPMLTFFEPLRCPADMPVKQPNHPEHPMLPAPCNP